MAAIFRLERRSYPFSESFESDFSEGVPALVTFHAMLSKKLESVAVLKTVARCSEQMMRRLTGWTSERLLRGGPMKFALLYYFYDPAQAGPTEGELSDWLALDAQINEAGAHVYGAGFHPESTARTVSVRDGQASTEGAVA
jgi:hypothetical protein